jgi:predicted enzyme related to lactoylglutathione lyase
VLRAVSLALVFACFALAVADESRKKPPARKHVAPQEMSMIQGLRTVVYHVDDLAKAKQWYASVLGRGPYFDQPFYAGFNVGGYELGLSPDAAESRGGSAFAYWGVADCKAAYQRLLDLGAKAHAAPEAVGDGIVVATVTDPWGNIFGVIENPHFKAEGAGE